MRVLIADDSLVMRRLLEVTLRGWGYEVVSAADGAEAWEILQSEDAPPLAILDWIMPVFTGPELCRLVRGQSRPGYTYILLLTSKSQREDIVQGMDAGADDYVTKPFDQHELEARLRAGRRIVDLQIQLMRAQEELRDQATRDSLTRCWNRAYIMAALTREIDRAVREKSWLGLLMLDLDHFKTVNDSYGHSAGDAVLREVVARIFSSMRSYDLLGRYGGEEFLVILPGCDLTNTIHHGERLRQAMLGRPVNVGSAQLAVSASFGAVSLPPRFAASADQILHLADEALYRAKARGRNRVESAGVEELGGGAVEAAQGLAR
jgi:diguanylate cyclase (GGDEF)-like protein